jgi:hypothetical protein
VSAWLGKVALGVIVLATLTTVAFLNPIRASHSPKAPTESIVYDEEISIPKVAGGPGSMSPVPNTLGGYAVSDQSWLPSGWTPLEKGNDPGQLLVDVATVRLWRNVERYASFQYIPKPHTIDENRNKLIRDELISDAFKCSEGTAQKIRLTVYYEDGTEQRYYPWRYGAPWKRVSPNTALSREMKFVCALQLTSESPKPVKLDVDRIFGTWHGEAGARGRIAGPIVVSETQIAWTAEDKRTCVVDYHLASRGTGSTFPGGPTMSDKPGDAYTTFVLELGEHHCGLRISSFTISLPSDQMDLAHFAAFFGTVQGYGTFRRVSAQKSIPINVPGF